MAYTVFQFCSDRVKPGTRRPLILTVPSLKARTESLAVAAIAVSEKERVKVAGSAAA
jgi:hypothetical protein